MKVYGMPMHKLLWLWYHHPLVTLSNYQTRSHNFVFQSYSRQMNPQVRHLIPWPQVPHVWEDLSQFVRSLSWSSCLRFPIIQKIVNKTGDNLITYLVMDLFIQSLDCIPDFLWVKIFIQQYILELADHSIKDGDGDLYIENSCNDFQNSPLRSI